MKRFVVTGASRGIGQRVSEKLAIEGHSVVLAARNTEKLARVKESLSCERDGQQHDVVPLDLSTFKDPKQWEYDQPVNGLINSAGIAPHSLLLRQSPEQLAEVFQVNTLAPMLLTKALLKPILRANQGGDFIFLSSVLASQGVAGMAAYGASKAAMESFVKTMARELAPKDIRVNAIAPALVDTDMGRAANYERLIALNAVQEFIGPDDIANAVLFLLSTKSVNGSVLRVDHGAGA